MVGSGGGPECIRKRTLVGTPSKRRWIGDFAIIVASAAGYADVLVLSEIRSNEFAVAVRLGLLS